MTLVGVATGGAVLLALGQALALLAALVAPGSTLDALSADVLLVSIFVYLAGVVGAAIAVPMWMHRVFRNLPALGAVPGAWSPAWAAGGWFIPLAQYVIPFLVARELWRRVHFDSTPAWALLQLWWAAWVAAYALQVPSNIAGRFAPAGGDLLGILANLATVAAGVMLIVIIQRVTSRERARYAQLLGGA